MGERELKTRASHLTILTFRISLFDFRFSLPSRTAEHKSESRGKGQADKMPQAAPKPPSPPIVFLMTTINRNNWTTQVLPSKYELSPAGASDLRREDLAPRASRHDRGGTEFLFFTSGPFEGARFFFSYLPSLL